MVAKVMLGTMPKTMPKTRRKPIPQSMRETMFR
jgi:hypothetical protein